MKDLLITAAHLLISLTLLGSFTYSTLANTWVGQLWGLNNG